jgi:hypothetical protein
MEKRFSWLFEDARSNSRPLWDRVILSAPGAKTLPTLGALVPGWVLTFASRPTLNLASLEPIERRAVLDQARAAARVVAPLGAKVFQFEHGPAFAGSVLGCGLDIAHLHTVPLSFDLIEAAKRSDLGDVEWSDVLDDSDPWASVGETEYMVIREVASSRAVLGRVKRPVSQMIRKIIASETGQSDRWDYRKFDGATNVEVTVGAFNAHDGRHD